jgi:hypothetical protein
MQPFSCVSRPALLAAVALAAVLTAASPATAGGPCCDIKKVDVKGSPCCEARVTATGQTFAFAVPRALMPRLKVGQAVNLDVRTRRVTIPGLPGSFEVQGTLPTGGQTGLGGFEGGPLPPRGGGKDSGCGLMTAGQTYQNTQNRSYGDLLACCQAISTNCELTVIGTSSTGPKGTKDPDTVPISYQCTCH